MILGFRANINQDTHRIFLTRLVNLGVSFNGTQSVDDKDVYSFVFSTEQDYERAIDMKDSMSKHYKDVPIV